jgi:hypothetical protein
MIAPQIDDVICFDFDGVLNNYQGWRDEGFDVILDKPFHDTVQSMQDIRAMGYRVVVHSVRCAHEGGIKAIREWLDEHGIEVDDVTAHKPLACIYVDDRGYHHTNWDDTVEMLMKRRRSNIHNGVKLI